MNPQYFALVDDVTKGPFDRNEISSLLSSWPQMLIWGPDLSEWIDGARWALHLSELNAPKKLSSGSEADQRKWKLRIDEHDTEELSYTQMLDILKSRDDIDSILIWTEGYSDWRYVYQIHRLADDLGLSRRKHPRVPIMGTLQCDGARGKFDLKALSISEGGLGASEGSQCRIGDRFKVVLKSPNLFAPVHAAVEVVYVAPNGYVGLKFSGVQIESKSAVIEYVRKFQDELSQTHNKE
ncbi:MAG: PilZ domain-containing protein [Bdellovibrio sp.]